MPENTLLSNYTLTTINLNLHNPKLIKFAPKIPTSKSSLGTFKRKLTLSSKYLTAEAASPVA